MSRLPEGVDRSAPNVARMYDYYLGGKDNFEADRLAAEEIMRLVPQIRVAAVANRAFLGWPSATWRRRRASASSLTSGSGCRPRARCTRLSAR